MRWRLLLLFILSVSLSYVGVNWDQTNKNMEAMALDLDFKSVQRLLYDEDMLRLSPQHQIEQVTAGIHFLSKNLSVLLSMLPSSEGIMSAIAIEVPEDQFVELASYVLIREELALRLGLEAEGRLMQGPLSINGKVHGRYVLFANPFHWALLQGLGPLAKVQGGKVILSENSRRFEILRKRGEEHAKELLSTPEGPWYAWDDKAKKWLPWGSWPKEWGL